MKRKISNLALRWSNTGVATDPPLNMGTTMGTTMGMATQPWLLWLRMNGTYLGVRIEVEPKFLRDEAST